MIKDIIEKTKDIIEDEPSKIKDLIKESLNYTFFSQWQNDYELRFYAFDLSNPEKKISMGVLFKCILASEETQLKIYNMWMDLYR